MYICIHFYTHGFLEGLQLKLETCTGASVLLNYLVEVSE